MDENDRRERRAFLARMEEHLTHNEVQEALDLAHARLEQNPGDLSARIILCRVWLLQGRLDEARDILNEIEEIVESFSHVYACMGDICQKRGMREAAEDYYGKFRALHPAPPDQDAADRPEGERGVPETGGEAEEAAAVPQGFRTVTLAELHVRQGHLRSAETLLEEILGREPQNGRAAELLANVRERLRREASAQTDAGIVAELSRWLDQLGRLRNHAT